MIGDVKVRTTLATDARVKESKRRQQGKKQYNRGLQERRLPAVQGSAWKNSVGHHTGNKRGLREMVDFPK